MNILKPHLPLILSTLIWCKPLTMMEVIQTTGNTLCLLLAYSFATCFQSFATFFLLLVVLQHSWNDDAAFVDGTAADQLNRQIQCCHKSPVDQTKKVLKKSGEWAPLFVDLVGSLGHQRAVGDAGNGATTITGATGERGDNFELHIDCLI